MTVYLVGAGPGDPGLLTRRGAALLARADVVLHDRLVSAAVLDLVPPSALVIDVGKEPDTPDGGANLQKEIARLLVEHGRASAVVVRLKGGDPFLFGRGGEEVEALARAGIAWEVVPGVTSAFGVPAAVGIPVTQRGVAASVTVVTGRVGESDGTTEHDWEALARVSGTLVVLMGMTNRGAIAAALMKGGRAPDTAVAVIASGTTASERVARTTLAGLADIDLGPPAVIVVGPVAALGPHDAASPAFAERPLAGRTVVVTRGGERARGLVDALEQGGATALELPLTRQVDAEDGGIALRAAAAAVRDNAWVVLTSVTAVERFMGALRDARDLGSVLVAAVGPATADALRRAGVEADLVPAEPSARGLVDAFPDWAQAAVAPRAVPRGGPGGWNHHGRALPVGLGRPSGGGLSDGGARRTRAGAAGPVGDGRCADVHRARRVCTRSWPCAQRMAGRFPRHRSSSASGRRPPRRPGRPGSTTCARPGMPRPRASSTS